MSELFIEVRCEELPAAYVRPALAALAKGIVGLLEGIEHGDAKTWATPRRLAVAVQDVAAGRPKQETLVTGPPADRAFVDGQPTGAAKGFARGKGVAVEDLEVVDGPRGKVVAARVTEGGERTADLVAAGLDGIVRGLPFKKSMQWGEGGVSFGRPLQSISALYSGEALSGTAAGCAIGQRTEGHRLAADTSFTFDSASSWLAGLRQRSAEPDLEARAACIRTLLEEATATLGSDPIADEDLEEEVLHLVEQPVLVISAFDEELLELPPRLLVEAMKVHQRYFPVYKEGALTHHFVVIGNNPWCDHDTVADGNARVLRPRFYDARFFFAEDRKLSLEEHGAGLDKMRWVRGMGNLADKQDRVSRVAASVAVSVLDETPQLSQQAGALCKSDLVSKMVAEFPKLQGHVGRLLARNDGLPETVSLAIEEHYLPRYADDGLPMSTTGRAVALADRLDTLVGCFGIGMKPKGGDPQGLRRAALGVVRILVDANARVKLPDLFNVAAQQLAGADLVAWDKASPDVDALTAELTAFTLTRFRAWISSQGLSADVVDAVLAVTEPDPVVLAAKCEALRQVAGTPEFLPIMHTFKRVLNISRGQSARRPTEFTHDAERALWAALQTVEDDVADASAALDFSTALERILTLQRPVAEFFDAVLVDSPVAAEKEVRMGILLAISEVFLRVADFSRISTR
jgi:glycyl-tRNA synthetase beta chain